MGRRLPLDDLHNSMMEAAWLQATEAVDAVATLSPERAARIKQGIDDAFRRDEAEQAGVPFARPLGVAADKQPRRRPAGEQQLNQRNPIPGHSQKTPPERGDPTD